MGNTRAGAEPVTQDEYRAQQAASRRELLAKASGLEAELVAETGETTAEWFRRVVPVHVQAEMDLGTRTQAVRLPAPALARRRGAGRPRTAATRSGARSGDSGDDDPAPADADLVPLLLDRQAVVER